MEPTGWTVANNDWPSDPPRVSVKELKEGLKGLDNVLYDEKYYSNGWTYAELDSYIKYKVAYYWDLLDEMPSFKSCACTLSYIGLSEDDYYEWEVNDRLHERISRMWPKPSWDWTKE